jgi:ribonuclease P protein component
MLAKKFRLTHRQVDFTKSSGLRVSTNLLTIVFSKNSEKYNRFAVVTSTKMAKQATVRNKLRRQIYSCLYRTAGFGHDIIIFPKPAMLELSYAEVNSEVHQILSKAFGVDKRTTGL